MRVLSFISCEDVRLEMGGKVTLVGVFDGLVINTSQIPAVVRIAAHLRFEIAPDDPMPDENTMRVCFNGAEIANGTSRMTPIQRNHPGTLAAPMLLLPVTGPGQVTFEYSFRSNGAQLGEVFAFAIPIEVPDAPAIVA